MKVIKPILKPFLYPLYSRFRHQRRLIFFRKFIKVNDLCFDIGANVGDVTTLFIELGASVISVEPQPMLVENLKKKFSTSDKVRIISAGLSSEPGSMEFSICSANPNVSTFSEEWKEGRFKDYSWDRNVVVQVTTLDKLIEQFGVPKFCKIDVEGYEYSVISGLSQSIPFLSFEFTKEFLYSNSARCLKYLRKLGYKMFNLAYGVEPAFRFRKWVDDQTIHKEIDKQLDPLTWGDIYAAMV